MIHSEKNNAPEHRPFLGAFELALFMKSSIERFPSSRKAALKSFLVPLGLLFLWVYPFSVVPTDILGERTYPELILMHLMVLCLHFPLTCLLLWYLLIHLDKTDRFWRMVSIFNYANLIGFTVTAPLLITVLNGHHTWDEIFSALILISYYEVGIMAYALTRGLSVPWQFGTGLAFLSTFIWDGAWTTVFSIMS